MSESEPNRDDYPDTRRELLESHHCPEPAAQPLPWERVTAGRFIVAGNGTMLSVETVGVKGEYYASTVWHPLEKSR